MHIGKKKITISALIVVVFVSVIVWAATSYPNAAISFSGIKMVANGSTTQGFVDISLKNIDSTAISYCIEYDKNYIELSDDEYGGYSPMRVISGGINLTF